MKKIRNKIQEEKGITLIALVITIIVLIILAGISIQLLLGQNGIITRAKEAKVKTDRASAKEKVVLAVGGSYGEDGEIKIDTLKENLQKTEGVTGSEGITKLPAQIEVDGHKATIKENGEVVLDEEIENESVYARLYKRNGTDEEVLILASKESSFQDYSDELTLDTDFKDIYGKITEEDLYEMPEYAEILNSEEWKKYKEENPEEAEAVIKQLIDEISNDAGSTIPWLQAGDSGTHYNVNLVEVRIIDKILPKSTASWFERCSNLQQVKGLEKLDTSNVTDMKYMFYGCSNLTAVDLSNFNTSNVTNMYEMFDGCSNLTTLDLSNFDTSNVTNMEYMFRGCSKLTTIDLSSFDTSRVERIICMFENCSNLTTLNLSNFDTSNITLMQDMFNGCSNLTTIDLSSFDTSGVTSMWGMFEDCGKLTKLDLRSFTTNNETMTVTMFQNCASLTEILVSEKWSKDVLDDGEFQGCGVSKVTYVTE